MLEQSRIDAMLTDPRISRNPAPPALLEAFTTLFPKFVFAGEAFSVLDDFANHDSRVKGYAQVFRSNPEDAARYLDIVQKAAKRPEPLALEGAINLFGVTNARNWILALALYRAVKGTDPDWSKPFQPNVILAFATKTETDLGGEGSRATDLAFVAAMLFDAFILLSEQEGKNKKSLMELTQATFEHGLKTSLVIRSLAKFAGKLPNAEMAAAAAILHDSGKVLLSFLKPELAAFRTKLDKKVLPRVMQHRAETLGFSTDHSLASALLCRVTGWFGPIEKPILHHHCPALIKTRDPQAFAFATVLALSTNIASAFRKPTGNDDPIIDEWIGPEIQGGPLSRDAILSAIKSILPAA